MYVHVHIMYIVYIYTLTENEVSIVDATTLFNLIDDRYKGMSYYINTTLMKQIHFPILDTVHHPIPSIRMCIYYKVLTRVHNIPVAHLQL